MRAAGADHAVDLAPDVGARPRVAAPSAGLGWLSSIVSSSAATGGPIAAQSGSASSRARISASRSDVRRGVVAQFGQPGPAQQRAQRRIAERGPVELGEMRVAAAIGSGAGVADVVERRAVLPGRQRAAGGAGDMVRNS